MRANKASLPGNTYCFHKITVSYWQQIKNINFYVNTDIVRHFALITHGETPKIETDAELKLIYVSELVNEIIEVIIEERKAHVLELKHSFHIRVSEVLELLNRFKEDYFQNCIIPNLNNRFELNLFNTFRSYIETKEFYPKKFSQNTDARGSFTEIIRVGDGVRSQISFSTTLPGKTRGNHFHTRKVERFAVIKGSALIQTRKIGTSDILEFHLSGENPAFVDMPIWYAHNIKNVGEEELVTIFWINEFFDANDPDTFFEEV